MTPGPLFSRKPDTQRDSTIVSGVATQASLFGDQAIQPQEISLDFILSRQQMRDVLKLGQQAAGMTDKQVCRALGVDKSTWSRILSGDANVPQEKWTLMCQLFLDLPLHWLARRRGFEVRPLQSDLERQVAQLTAALAEERGKNETITKFMREIGR